jgi:hypothetical protein
MANVDYPHGLNAVMSRFADTPRMRKYAANVTTGIFRGDVVTLLTNGRVATLLTSTGAANVIGVAANYNAAATTPAVDIWVYDDPDTIYEIQSDGTTDPTLATSKAAIGATAALTITTGDTASGQSKHELDYNTLGTTITEVLKVVGIYNIVGNDAALMNARYLVVLQKHHFQKSAAGI